MVIDKDKAKRYSRHFALKEIGVSGQKKLLSSKVLVIGAGGLGSPVIMYLAAAGVGTIGIADGDTVDVSNLQRQIIHNEQSVGVPKTVSAKRTAESIAPDVNVVIHEGLVTAENIIKGFNENIFEAGYFKYAFKNYIWWECLIALFLTLFVTGATVIVWNNTGNDEENA